MFRPSRSRYDVVVIGAHCASAATAMLLARAGASVLLLDRQTYGSDTLSTHALMRAGVLQLHRWGLLPQVMAAGTPRVHTTTFHYADAPLRIAMKPEHGIDHLCGPRRTVLDRILADALRDAELLVRALINDMLPAYHRQRDMLSKPLFKLTDAITSFRWDLAEIAKLHTRLSAAMKAETEYVAGPAEPGRMVAKEDA